MKKILPFLALLLLIAPLVVLAQEPPRFIPITNIPVLDQAGNAASNPGPFSLDNFLNTLYKIAIGLAAVAAVIQIMISGILYMGGDSVTEKKEAKNRIALAIGGLILVLSPVVVFSIVNPEILSLKINNIGQLATEEPPVPETGSPAPVCPVLSSYREFRAINLEVGQTCREAIGDGWLGMVDANRASCCAGIANGAACCGLMTSYQPPAPDPSQSNFYYRYITRDTSAPACQLPEATRGFETRAACDADQAQVAGDNNTVITRNCGGQDLSPPTPEARWNEIRTLPVCDA